MSNSSSIVAMRSTNVSARVLTTTHIGAPVLDLYEPRTVAEVSEVLSQHPTPAILGGGSNLIFPDSPLQRVVMRPRLAEFSVDEHAHTAFMPPTTTGRYTKGSEVGVLALADEVPMEGEFVFVTIGAGVPWGQAVQWTLQQGLLGLHRYARIPCRVGGAVYNNIHAKEHLLAEHIAAVQVVHPERGSYWVSASECSFGYDYSRFHVSGETITAVQFALVHPNEDGHLVAAKEQYRLWGIEKARVQPSEPNAGSVFQNLDTTIQEQHGVSMAAAGWYLDQLGAKGTKEGGVMVSERHANFIIAEEDARQEDWITLVELLRKRVYEAYGFFLHPEVVCWDEQATAHRWLSSF